MQFIRSIAFTSLVALVGLVGCAKKLDQTSLGQNPQKVQKGNLALKKFQNSGGMWMPEQIRSHAKVLKKIGVEIPADQLADPLKHPLGAIVSLQYCSASFVSPDGLIITNHHCVQSLLQHNSAGETDLIKNGFLAKSRTDELFGGPTERVLVTTNFEDVTKDILDGIEKIQGDKAKYEEIEKRQKELTKKCEKGKSDTRCTVASFYKGARFFQIEQLEIRDVRLVYSPHKDIGFFGGDEDNWRWPRHTGDYSFIRAYVGKDGKPADYSKDNVPFQPKHFLKPYSKPLKEGDFVMVAGYPGRTYRFLSEFEVSESITHSLPRMISIAESYIALLDKISAANPDLKEKIHTNRFSLSNSHTYFKGSLEGLKKANLVKDKKDLEGKVQKWINADATRLEKYGQIFKELQAKREESLKSRPKDEANMEILNWRWSSEMTPFWGMNLLKAGLTIARMAEERQKADKDRDPSFQERNWNRLEESQKTFQKDYSPLIEKASLKLFLKRNENSGAGLLSLITAGANDIEASVDALYGDTKLGDLQYRLDLLKKTPEELKAIDDSVLKLAIAYLPIYLEYEKRLKEFAGSIAVLQPRYVGALLEYQGGDVAPDANSTLRITYGKVRGYRPNEKAAEYFPFTKVSGLVAKHQGVAPFNVPANLIKKAVEGLTTGGFGSYHSKEVKQLPINFLSDLDITGGNSGSATLNSRGELVGLAFDGNYEAMASDYVFMPKITRAIHVDLRYVLWIMDAVDDADHLIKEMGLTPEL